VAFGRTWQLAAVAAVAAAVAAGTAGTADARPADPAPPSGPSAMVLHQADPADSARLHLTGNGKVVLRGRLAVSGNLASRATVTIVDRAGDASVVVDGVTARFKRGRATVRRAQGIVWAAGSDLTLQVKGRGIDLAAAGLGKARLTGKGTYRLNTERTRTWPRSWVNLLPDESPRAIVRGRRR